MIRLTHENPDLIKMEIKMHLPQLDVIRFLQEKGYEVKAFSYVLPATEEFLLSEPPLLVNTFTATKPGEQQSPEKEYLKAFEREIRELLKELS